MKSSVTAVKLSLVLVMVLAAGFAQENPRTENTSARKPVIYVMPNALAGPANDGSQMVAESSHNGREPQVAKIYYELQQSRSCQNFAENMIKEKADYYLLLQHGGGKGNRWAASDREGNVIASGESYKLGTSVNDACTAIAKDWQKRPQSSSDKSAHQQASR
jgi:hypothetical protein